MSGFGSLIVDGVAYDDRDARFLPETLDGHSQTASLKIGQRVGLQLRDDGSIDTFEIRPHLRGPVTRVPFSEDGAQWIEVLGFRVRVLDTNAGGFPTTILEGFETTGSIQSSSMVEVHGSWVAETSGAALYASRIATIDNTPSHYKLGGLIEATAAGTLTLRGNNLFRLPRGGAEAGLIPGAEIAAWVRREDWERGLTDAGGEPLPVARVGLAAPEPSTIRELRVSAPLQIGQINSETGSLRINGLEVFVPPGLRAQLADAPQQVSVTVTRAENGQLTLRSIARPEDAPDRLGESIRLKAVLRLPEQAPSRLTMRDTEVEGFEQALAASPSCSALPAGEMVYLNLSAVRGPPGARPSATEATCSLAAPDTAIHEEAGEVLAVEPATVDRPAMLLIAQPGSAPPLRVELPPGSALSSEAARTPTVAGARVFLDLNRNLTQDEGEPESEPTNAAGRFTLSIDRTRITDAQIDQALVVARADTEGARAQLPVPMAAPAAVLRSGNAAREINMITHLVASEMAVVAETQADDARRQLTPDEAVARIRKDLPSLAATDLFAGIASAPEADALRNIARLIAAKVLAERDAVLRSVAEARVREEAFETAYGDDGNTSVAMIAAGGDPGATPDPVRVAQKEAELKSAPPELNLAELVRQARETLPAVAALVGTGSTVTEKIEDIKNRIEDARQAAEAALALAREQAAQARQLELAALLEKARAAVQVSQPSASLAPPPELGPLPDPARIARELAAEREALRNLNRVTLIVVFKPKESLPASERRDAASRRNEVLAGLPNDLQAPLGRVFERAIEGFTVTLPEQVADRFIERMQNHPRVDRVEIDEPVRIRSTTQTQSPTLSWGVDRSDANTGLSNSFSWSASGAGITAYVVDTGITPGTRFGSNQVLAGYTSISDGRGSTDCNGYGTHVAGTVASPFYGIAKDAALAPVRVLDCNGAGSLSTVIAGLDWVLKQVDGDRAKASRSVVNLSLGGGASSTLDQAAAKLIQSGVTVVVDAGNNADDACNYSPARVRDAITVAATDWNDARASFSNYGSCVDLFAPGQSITSVAMDGNNARTLSGTSMAAPHVTGAVAQWLEASPGLTPAQVTERLLAAATQSVVNNTLGSPNLLLFAQAQTGTDSGGGDSTEPTLTTVSVGGLSASSARVSRNGNWRASVSVLIRDASGNAVPGATVTGDFTAGGTGLSCTTGSTGRCTIASGTLSKNLKSTTWTVKAVAGSGLQYQASGNSASSITVSAPR